MLLFSLFPLFCLFSRTVASVNAVCRSSFVESLCTDNALDDRTPCNVYLSFENNKWVVYFSQTCPNDVPRSSGIVDTICNVDGFNPSGVSEVTYAGMATAGPQGWEKYYRYESSCSCQSKNGESVQFKLNGAVVVTAPCFQAEDAKIKPFSVCDRNPQVLLALNPGKSTGHDIRGSGVVSFCSGVSGYLGQCLRAEECGAIGFAAQTATDPCKDGYVCCADNGFYFLEPRIDISAQGFRYVLEVEPHLFCKGVEEDNVCACKNAIARGLGSDVDTAALSRTSTDEESSSSTSLIIGIVVGSVAFICCIAALGGVFIVASMRRRRQRRNERGASPVASTFTTTSLGTSSKAHPGASRQHVRRPSTSRLSRNVGQMM